MNVKKICITLTKTKDLPRSPHYKLLSIELNKRVLEGMTEPGFPTYAPHFVNFARVFKLRDPVTLQAAVAMLNATDTSDVSLKDLSLLFGSYNALAYTSYRQDAQMC